MNTALIVEVNNVLSLADKLFDTINSTDDPNCWDAAVGELHAATANIIDLYRGTGEAGKDSILMSKLNYHTNKVLKALGA